MIAVSVPELLKVLRYEIALDAVSCDKCKRFLDNVHLAKGRKLIKHHKKLVVCLENTAAISKFHLICQNAHAH